MLPDLKDWTSCYDYVHTVIKQMNSCPICHLPLIYNEPVYLPDIDPPKFEEKSDYYWARIQQIMKEGAQIQNESYLFGQQRKPGDKGLLKTNGEKCHYVSKTMVPEISRPRLYETPAVIGLMRPEPQYYIAPPRRRIRNQHKLFDYNMAQLFPHGIAPHRLSRAGNFFQMSGTKYFLGCSDCNQCHTGHHQLSLIMDEAYKFNQTRTGMPKPANMYNMYTAMFDSMANYTEPFGINVTEERCNTWQIELWIHYCSIMFLAQHASEQNRKKYTKWGVYTYAFHYAHRDMGLCDFYMSQILAAILYCNYDIDVDFTWLHQSFLSNLALWAERNHLFISPKQSTHCLWRLVMGNKDTNQIFPVYTDVAYGPNKNHYNKDHTDLYWLHVDNPCTVGNLISKKITEFCETWLKYIGMVIDVGNARAGKTGYPATSNLDVSQFSPREQDIMKKLLEFYQDRTGIYEIVDELPSLKVTYDEVTDTTRTTVEKEASKLIMTQSSLDVIEGIFYTAFPSKPPTVQNNIWAATPFRDLPAFVNICYYNLFHLSIPRTRALLGAIPQPFLEDKWQRLKDMYYLLAAKQRTWAV